MSLSGSIQKVMVDKGYGFIERGDGQESVFCHFSALTNGGSADMLVGTHLTYDLIEDKNSGRMRAANVTLAEAGSGWAIKPVPAPAPAQNPPALASPQYPPALAKAPISPGPIPAQIHLALAPEQIPPAPLQSQMPPPPPLHRPGMVLSPPVATNAFGCGFGDSGNDWRSGGNYDSSAFGKSKGKGKGKSSNPH
mmetsp:Transcript_16323/g.28593  ORF Transcript_16323/g.28593 Transcript_16323/m.28593 type:complete len:194 (-) Transcript_16323:221-802(-)